MDKREKHYNKESKIYDNERWSSAFGKYINSVEQDKIICHIKAGSKVLELCCGTGRFGKNLTDLGCEYHGVDISEGMLKKARFKNKNIKGVKFYKHNVDELDTFEGKGYDAIFVARALKFWKVPFQVISDSYDKLNKNGVIILTFMNNAHPIFRSLQFINDYIIDTSKIKLLSYYQVGCEKYYTKPQIEEMLNRIGFKVIYKRSHFNLLFYTQFKGKLAVKIFKLIDNKFDFGWRNIIVGIKEND